MKLSTLALVEDFANFVGSLHEEQQNFIIENFEEMLSNEIDENINESEDLYNAFEELSESLINEIADSGKHAVSDWHQDKVWDNSVNGKNNYGVNPKTRRRGAYVNKVKQETAVSKRNKDIINKAKAQLRDKIKNIRLNLVKGAMAKNGIKSRSEELNVRYVLGRLSKKNPTVANKIKQTIADYKTEFLAKLQKKLAKSSATPKNDFKKALKDKAYIKAHRKEYNYNDEKKGTFAGNRIKDHTDTNASGDILKGDENSFTSTLRKDYVRSNRDAKDKEWDKFNAQSLKDRLLQKKKIRDKLASGLSAKERAKEVNKQLGKKITANARQTMNKKFKKISGMNNVTQQFSNNRTTRANSKRDLDSLEKLQSMGIQVDPNKKAKLQKTISNIDKLYANNSGWEGEYKKKTNPKIKQY